MQKINMTYGRIGALLVPVVAFGAACFNTNPLGDDRPVVARVNGYPIYQDDFKRAYARMQFDSDGALDTEGSKAGQRRVLLDSLIEQRLLLAEAEQHNILVGMDEVDALYARTRRGWTDPAPGEECEECSFDALLGSQDLTVAELKRELRNDLLIRKYFRDNVFARVAVTDAEIDAFLAAHPERRTAPEEVRALQILVKTKEEAQSIAQELRQGLSFEEAAMKYSLSPEGKAGGDLGYFSRGTMPAVFDEACFGLKPGNTSQVVASGYGFHLFKVVDVKPARELPHAQVREAVEGELRRAKEHAAQLAKIQELQKAAKIVIEEKRLESVE